MNIYEKMREALEQSANLMDRILVRTELDDEIHRIALEAQNAADGALLLSPRNCDVGTPKEMSKRMAKFCGEQYKKKNGVSLCSGCRFHDIGGLDCQFAWAQMPYEEGGNK